MKFTGRLLCLLALMLSCAICLSAEEWQRPSFAGQEVMFAGVVKESTVEEVIAAIDLCEEKGAMGIDLHLNYLNDSGLLTEENLQKICRSTALPILAINYDSDMSQADRRETLLLAARAGCAAVDFPGFMFCESSTSVTHTEANVAYWEKLGYDMSFVETAPKETVLDPEMLAQQKAFVDSVHALGAEVLRSFHVKTVFTAEQAVAYLRFQDQIGADVLKLVGYGYNQEDVEACVAACKTLRDDPAMQTKFSYHISGGVGGRITRILCPTFYGSYIAFCYPVLTDRQDANQLDLDMAIACLAAKDKADKDISVADAIALLQSVCTHPDLVTRITQYENCMTVGKAYATSSDLSKRWAFDGDTYSIRMRTESSTSSYSLRAYAYDSTKTQADRVCISATVSGDCTPYVSATRVPKAGVYIGTEEKMLAFVYNAATKTVDLVSNSENVFTFDKEIKKDALLSLGKISLPAYSADITAGDKFSLGMELTADTLRLYAGADAPVLIAVIPVTAELRATMEANADGTYNAGVLAEMYMGNASKGRENTLTFTGVTYGSLVGDLDGDGVYSVSDVLLLITAMVEGTDAADMNGDGRTTLADALRLLKMIAL